MPWTRSAASVNLVRRSSVYQQNTRCPRLPCRAGYCGSSLGNFGLESHAAHRAVCQRTCKGFQSLHDRAAGACYAMLS